MIYYAYMNNTNTHKKHQKEMDRNVSSTCKHCVPSVRRAFPPVGWQRTVEQPTHSTTV